MGEVPLQGFRGKPAAEGGGLFLFLLLPSLPLPSLSLPSHTSLWLSLPSLSPPRSHSSLSLPSLTPLSLSLPSLAPLQYSLTWKTAAPQ